MGCGVWGRLIEVCEEMEHVHCAGQYCMPAEGVPLCARSDLLTAPEMERVVRVLARAGVRKVRLTGGEPTLRADLPALVRALRRLPGIETLAITTNGLVLTRRLPALHAAGLTAINVSLDSLRPDRYERMARRPVGTYYITIHICMYTLYTLYTVPYMSWSYRPRRACSACWPASTWRCSSATVPSR